MREGLPGDCQLQNHMLLTPGLRVQGGGGAGMAAHRATHLRPGAGRPGRSHAPGRGSPSLRLHFQSHSGCLRGKEKRKSLIRVRLFATPWTVQSASQALASLVAQLVKNPPAIRETGFRPWVGKILWRRAWQITPVLLPGESPRTEEPGGLQSVGLQSQTRLSDQAQHRQDARVTRGGIGRPVSP